MATLISLPIIKNRKDLDEALERLDAIFHAQEGTSEADERAGLLDLIEAFENRETVNDELFQGNSIGIIRRLMETHELSQAQIPEIGRQSVVSEVLNGKRKINARMAKELSNRFGLPTDAFLQEEAAE